MAALVESLDAAPIINAAVSNGVGHDSDASDELSELSQSDSDAGPRAVEEPAKSGEQGKKLKSVVQGGKLLAAAFSRTLQQTSKKDLRVLGKSQETLKRRREELDETREAKVRAKARREILLRGRTVIPDPGEDAEHDQTERELRKLATRGVIRLFNMVSKFKKQEIMESKEKAAKNKKRFLSEMRKPLEQEEVPFKNKKPFAKAEAKKKKEWEALQDSFTGLDGGTKNWDQYDSDESEGDDKGNNAADSDESESGDDQDDVIDDDDDASSDDDDSSGF